MPKIVKPLTDSQIKRLKPQDKIVKLSDGNGLYFVIRPNGTKFFRFDYTFNKKRGTISVGTYPETTLAKARELRDEVKKKIKEGVSPTKKTDAKLFKEVLRAYMDKVPQRPLQTI